MMSDIFSYMVSIFENLKIGFNLTDFIQIVFLAAALLLLYRKFIKNTSSEKLVRGLFGLGLLWLGSFILPLIHLYLLGRFLHWIALFLSVGLIVIFQPELRKLLALMGSVSGWKNIIRDFKQDVKKSSEKQKQIF